MKVSDLKSGDIVWIYNSKEEYFAEFEFVKTNEDGTSRLHITGQESVDDPEYGYALESFEFRNIKLVDGSETKEIISTKGIKFRWLKIKEYFETLFTSVIEGLD